MKKRIFEILDVAAGDDVPSKAFDISILTLIFLNVLAVVLETVHTFASRFSCFLDIFEVFSVVVFTVEYALRLWSCTVDARFCRPIIGRLRFALQPILVVDLIAIAPFYLPMLIAMDLRFVRALRLLRVLRVLKMGRYSESLRTLARVLDAKRADLSVIVFVLVILLVVTSSLMYFVENDAQPECFSSIPAAMWWGVATLTTVGYGDMFPITPMGKLLGTVIALLGVGLFGLPAGILGSGFVEEMRLRRAGQRRCPHCGKKLDDNPANGGDA